MECSYCKREAGDVPKWQGHAYCSRECQFKHIAARVAEEREKRRPPEKEKKEYLSESAKKFLSRK